MGIASRVLGRTSGQQDKLNAQDVIATAPGLRGFGTARESFLLLEEAPLLERRFLALTLLSLVLALGVTVPASAGNFTVALFGGLGGSTDADPILNGDDVGIDNVGFQALFSAKTAPRTRFSLRAGILDLESDFGLENDLSYVTFTGEYRFDDDFYESGLFMGLGGYDLSGDAFQDETAIGITVGANGEFRLNPQWSVLVELSGHYADFEQANVFLMGHVGLAFDF